MSNASVMIDGRYTLRFIVTSLAGTVIDLTSNVMQDLCQSAKFEKSIYLTREASFLVFSVHLVGRFDEFDMSVTMISCFVHNGPSLWCLFCSEDDHVWSVSKI